MRIITLNESRQLAALAHQLFPATIDSVTDIVPVEDFQTFNANAVSFDFLAAVANVIYFIESLKIIEHNAVTGVPVLELYDIAAVAQGFQWAAGAALEYDIGTEWISRLRHATNGATAGQGYIIYSGWKLTYT